MAINLDGLNQELVNLFSNEEVVNQLNLCKSMEECYDIAKTHVSGISFKEFSESMKLINAYLEENKEGKLDINDLDEVAGGCHTCEIVGAAAAVVGAAASAAT